ncbi:MAG: TetR family transcriptional regulator [Draconibacterium sp.]|nr:MAG: TetR family transcriptional regulator [Draconibacterium sp.]
MQIQKKDVRKNILIVARKEFLEKGFKDASMRSIAKKADVSLSNIYNYFRNKDKIFREILSALLNTINRVMEEHNSPSHISVDILSSDEYMRSQIDMFVELIDNYKDDFKLLLFKSSGSSLANYREEIIELQTRVGKEYIGLMKEKFPSINGEISDFFIHTMSSWWMSIISELVMHDLSHRELERFIREYMEFGAAGWKRLMQVKN